MALRCYKIGFENPFEKKAVWHVMSPTEGPDRAAEAEKRGEAKEKIDQSRLIPESVKKLNDLLAKAPKEKIDVFLETLDDAISEMNAIEKMTKTLKLSSDMVKALWANFNDHYSDFEMSKDDMFALNQARANISERIALMDQHTVDNPEALKRDALLFLKENSTYLKTSSPLVLGKTYSADFKNPSTGAINTFAQAKLTWGDVFSAAGITKAEITQGSRKVIAYLWNDGNTYNREQKTDEVPPGSKSDLYVKLLESYKIKPLEEEEAAPLVAETSTQAPAAAPAVTVSGEDRDTFASITAPAATPDMSVRTGTTAEAGTEAVAETTDYSSLLTESAKLPAHFRGEDSYEQIQQMQYLQYGQKIYGAIEKMAATKTAIGTPTDNRNMWEAIRGGVIGGGGRYEVQFNEIARAFYDIRIGHPGFNKPGQWVLDQYENATGDTKKTYEAFLDASKDLLTYLPDAEKTGVSGEEYKEGRRAELSGEMKEASTYTDNYLFDKDSYGPPVHLNVFQTISYGLKGKDRPVITADNWLDEEATHRREGEAKNYGEIEIISQSHAYDKLMGTASPEKYVAALNRYLYEGAAEINALAPLLALRGIKLDVSAMSPADFTLEEIKAGKKPTKDQVQAVHYGMMIEAAKELHLYQEGEQRMTKEEQEEKDKIAYNHTGEIQGVGGVIASTGIDENGLNTPGAGGQIGAKLKVAPGTNVDAGLYGAQFSNGQTQAGLSVGATFDTERFGKEDRSQAGVGIHATADILSGDVGVNTNAYIEHDLNAAGTVAIKGGLDASAGTGGLYAGADVGAERDLSRVYEQRLKDFKEKFSGEIQGAKDQVRAAIESNDKILPSDKEALKLASDSYIDMIVEKGVMQDYTRLSKQLKLVGGGFKVGVGYSPKEGTFGVRAGPYITFAFGFRPVTLYVKPPMESGVLGSLDAESTGGAGEWVPAGSSVVAISIPDKVLWMGDEASEADAKAKAGAALDSAYEARNTGLKDYASLTPDGHFSRLDFKNLTGIVRLYMDPNGDMELIQSRDQVDLNMGVDKNLNLQIREYGAGQGGDNIAEVFLSDDINATPEKIKSDSNAFVTWTQQPDGTSTRHAITRLSKTEAAQKIYTAAEAEAALTSGDLELRGLSPDHVAEMTREVKREEVARQATARDGALFDEYDQADKDLARSVGESLRDNHIDYDTLTLGNHDEEINAQIVELYVDQGMTAEEVNTDRIYMARQYAMELARPAHKEVPIKWNENAFEQIAGEASKLYSNYMEAHMEGIKSGEMNGTLPQGSEFQITVSHDGQMRVIEGYYDDSLHGAIQAPIEWDKADPASTLAALGAEDTPENEAGVLKVADAIAGLEWKETPYNSLPEATFDKAMYTVAGELLLSNAVDLYGAEKAETLRKMAIGEETNPTIEAEFVKNVQDLLFNGQTMVDRTPAIVETKFHSGLYEKCMNLVLGKSLTLKFVKPAAKEVQVKATRERMEKGLKGEQVVHYTKGEVGIGLPKFTPGVVIPTIPNEVGSGTQHVIPSIDPSQSIGDVIGGSHNDPNQF